MERVVVTRQFVGICHMQVCAASDASDEEILSVANTENPSGTDLGWTRVVRSGDGGQVPCADDSGRVHLLLVC